ncbi:hypothetical protein RSSM_06716 [Rhodopirellula sallentina SM41]|uniref:Uncharacterized protein n=1 Tax=Rhodopirellula sallentina SM41 TaxID=1263870 RepID=M5TS10_9BACT|nr:hypothetical protein RSSM_06716 [Rhodopirellula sallentina SM41]
MAGLFVGLVAISGCGDGGNQVVEPAADPASMSLSPNPTEDIAESSKSMVEQMKPMSE